MSHTYFFLFKVRLNKFYNDTHIIPKHEVLMKSSNWKRIFKDSYASWWSPRVKELGFDQYYWNLLEIIGAQNPGVILDSGIGTGEHLALSLIKRESSIIQMHGIDISEALIRECQRNASGLPHGKLLLVCGDSEYLPYRDNMFDIVYCIQTTWYLPQIGQAVAEMSRVVQPGGKIIFDVMNWFHISVLTDQIRLGIKRLLGRSYFPQIARTHFQIRKILAALGLSFEVKGFFIFLTTGLPLLGDAGNLCKFSPLFSFGLQDSPARFFGAKLLYMCEKQK